MNVVRYQPRYRPLGLLGRLLQEDNLDALFDQEPQSVTDWAPAVDIREQDDSYILRADLPGVDPDNIEVTMEDGVLTIQGHRDEEKEENEQGYSRYERVSGSFLRRFSLPDTTNGDEIEAKTNHGVLEIVIPKQARLKPRKISVKPA